MLTGPTKWNILQREIGCTSYGDFQLSSAPFVRHSIHWNSFSNARISKPRFCRSSAAGVAMVTVVQNAQVRESHQLIFPNFVGVGPAL